VQPQLLIFDLDGTLVDSRADLAAGINHMRSHFGLAALSQDTVTSYVGSGVCNLVRRSLQGVDVMFQDALDIYRAYYDSHLAVHTTTYPGVRAGVQALARAGHKLALLSNKPGDTCRMIMRHFGLDRYFMVMLGGGDLDRLKPEPDGIFHCLELAGPPASATWMIGDHHTDLAVARNAGVRSAFVEYGFGDRDGHETKISFGSFTELVNFYI
jgi:phosphoglycolate phosphatase